MDANKVTIVTYHYVRDLKISRYPEIRGLEKDLFVNQLNYFKKNYSIVSIQEVLHAIESDKMLPGNALLLTFNDNYIDHFKNVFPILHDMNLSGCFFPEVKAIKEPIVLPNHKIHFILASTVNTADIVNRIYQLLDQLRPEYSLLQNEDYYSKLAGGKGYDSDEVVFIKKLLQNELPEKVSNQIINQLFLEFVDVSEEVLSKELYMTEKQIKCMHHHGMYFGIIGYNHKDLTSISINEADFEIKKSMSFFIDNGINPEMLTMSYPWNQTSDSIIDLLKNYGIKAAFTGGGKVADLNNESKYRLPRFDTNDFPKTSKI